MDKDAAEDLELVEEQKVDWKSIFAKPPPDVHRRPKRQPITLAEAVSVRVIKSKEKEEKVQEKEKRNKSSAPVQPSFHHKPAKRPDLDRTTHNPANGEALQKKGVERRRERPKEMSKLKTAILEERAHVTHQLSSEHQHQTSLASTSTPNTVSSQADALPAQIKTAKDARAVTLRQYHKRAPHTTNTPSTKDWKPFEIPQNFNPLLLHHIITPQYLDLVSSMLEKLGTYQARASASGHVGKRKKGNRFVSGLSHSLRSLTLRRSKMIILAMDIEDSTSVQALTSALWAEKTKIQLAAPTTSQSSTSAHFNALREQLGLSTWTGHSGSSISDVPFLFVPSRRLLAKYIHKRMPCSAVSIVNVDGAHEEWKRLHEEILPLLSSLSSEMVSAQLSQSSDLQRKYFDGIHRIQQLTIEEIFESQSASHKTSPHPNQSSLYRSRSLFSLLSSPKDISTELLDAMELKRPGTLKLFNSAAHSHFESDLPKESDLSWINESGKRRVAVRMTTGMEKRSEEGFESFAPSLSSTGSLTTEAFFLSISKDTKEGPIADGATEGVCDEMEPSQIDTQFEDLNLLPCYQQPFILKTSPSASSFPTLWSPWMCSKEGIQGKTPNALFLVFLWYPSFVECVNHAGGDLQDQAASEPTHSVTLLIHLPDPESSGLISTEPEGNQIGDEDEGSEDEDDDGEEVEEETQIFAPLPSANVPPSTDATAFIVNLEQSDITRSYISRIARETRGLVLRAAASPSLLQLSLPQFFVYPRPTMDLSNITALNITQSEPSPIKTPLPSAKLPPPPAFDSIREIILFVQLLPPYATLPPPSSQKRALIFTPHFQLWPALVTAPTHVIRINKDATIFDLTGRIAKKVQMAPKNIQISICGVPLSLLLEHPAFAPPKSASPTHEEEHSDAQSRAEDIPEEKQKKGFLSLPIDYFGCINNFSTLLASPRR